jgi:hypothetical protein
MPLLKSAPDWPYYHALTGRGSREANLVLAPVSTKEKPLLIAIKIR